MKQIDSIIQKVALSDEVKNEWLRRWEEDSKEYATKSGADSAKLKAELKMLEEKQAAAATGQIRLAHAYQETLARHGITVAQVLLTLGDAG